MKKVSIVDDDVAVFEVLNEALNDEDFEVKSLRWTYDIVGEIMIYNPQLILLDYLLPEVNGGELCHQIKSNEKTSCLPVIMFSAYPQVLKSLGHYGWDAFLEKPFDLWELIRIVKDLTKRDTDGSKKELHGSHV